MFQKISASEVGQSSAFFDMANFQGSPAMASVLGAIANPYSIVWVCISLSSIIILQFAYKKDKAIRIIPAYSATNIVLPLISGMLCFGERLSWIQWIGVVAILAGVFLITAKPKGAEEAGSGAA
jgi:multidrug transporter EmrE-like cation transporter